ncbi:hypothetical protein Taro_007748 [Colocasia esculenta]|uniref:Uncharacterized protein n=1 Tax=Colocasia esculenta TaxID=4460 RepID=A0A843U4W1_COLES|nr:hypothetical protein [Colocasia esculenta]
MKKDIKVNLNVIMYQIIGETTRKDLHRSLPYVAHLTSIFQHFGVSLENELAQSIPESNIYCFKHLQKFMGFRLEGDQVRRGPAVVEAPVAPEVVPPPEVPQSPAHEDQPPVVNEAPIPQDVPQTPPFQTSSPLLPKVEIPSFTPQFQASTSTGTNISYKGSVDTPPTGVDTMLQTLRQNDEEKCVDIGSSGVDTRSSSQKTCLSILDSVSTQPEVVSTLVTLPREQILPLSKNPHHLLDFQLCFAESERFSLHQWATAYPTDHTECEKMKLSPYEFLSKSLKDLKKSIGHKWAQRYLVYYQAKDAAVTRGLHWNITVHEFLHLAASKKFVHLKYRLSRDKYHTKIGWYHRRHIKSHRKLPTTSSNYNINSALFDNFFLENEKKLWDLLKPYLAQISRSLCLPSSLSRSLFLHFPSCIGKAL